jgi:hypothetical protein
MYKNMVGVPSDSMRDDEFVVLKIKIDPENPLRVPTSDTPGANQDFI